MFCLTLAVEKQKKVKNVSSHDIFSSKEPVNVKKQDLEINIKKLACNIKK